MDLNQIDAESAARSLQAIEQAEAETVRAIIFDVCSRMFILWGLLTAFGYTVGQLWPRSAAPTWIVINGVGLIASSFLLFRRMKRLSAAGRLEAIRLGLCHLTLILFGGMVIWLVGPLTPRQLDAFWPLVFMLGYVIAGLWVSHLFTGIGITIGTLTIVGYHWAGPWYGYWMAAIEGIVLIGSGLWLRQRGADL